jgi:hypothetical protein
MYKCIEKCIKSIVLGIFICHTVHASDTLLLKNGIDHIFVDYPVLKVLEDKKAQLTFPEIRTNQMDTAFIQQSILEPIIHKQGGVYWAKCVIINNSDLKDSWVFELLDFKIDDITVYIPDPATGKYITYHEGDDLPFSYKNISHKNFVYSLPHARNTPYCIYMRAVVTQNNPFFLFARISTQRYFTKYALTEYFLLALFYGIIICMVLYNSFLYLTTGGRVYLIYIFYILALAIFSLSFIDGIGFQYIWPGMPFLNTYLSELSITLFITGALAFAIYFLQTPVFYQRLHRMLLTAIGIRLIIGLCILVFPQMEIFKAFDLFFLSLIAFPAYLSFRQKELVTRNYFVSYLLMYSGFCIYTLQDYRLLPHTTIGYYSLNIGIIGEVIFLSLAIAEKSRLLIQEKNTEQQSKIFYLKERDEFKTELIEQLQEKEKLKNKVNLELEQKVTERTVELTKQAEVLQTLNTKLTKQSEEINRMASLLDIQNWSLKKELKTEVQARLQNEVLGLDAFSALYPNDFSCLKYISEIKWANGFSCRKCTHTKYSLNRTSLSRKCTRCSAIESVTNSTIFHGLRFPLHKAFYIAYLAVHEKDKTNATEVAAAMKLRASTWRRFFNLVKAKKQEVKKKLQIEELPSLDVVILYESI